MADCGATGSAIDRSARILSSAITGRNDAAADATARAGKAMSSFLGTASMPATTSAARPLMPSAPPEALIQASNSLGMMGGHGDQIEMNVNMNMGGYRNHDPSVMQGVGVGVGVASMSQSAAPFVRRANPLMHNPAAMHMQHMRHMHADAQMQMNMNMMNQQMAMMQMAQMQQQQLQQQQQQKSLSSQQRARHQSQNTTESLQSTHIKDNQEAVDGAKQGDEINQWHNHLEDDFESYLESYRQHQHRNATNDDVASTNEYEYDAGHEGVIDGATIEQLAEAWAEAEKDFMGYEDDVNFAAAYADQDDETLTKMRTEYDFNDLSENYGRQEDGSKEFTDLMDEGMKHFNEGNTKEAILCFESHLRNVDSDCSEAWLMLGKCNAENDEDRKAIACLENSVERDPYSTEALLSLGVSYVNELKYEQALKHLNNWVTHNPNLEVSFNVENIDDGNALDKVKALLNQAKDISRANGNENDTVDVLEALGVIYNVSREYDEAAKCFQAATATRPGDYQLWNKLGATLANNSQSEEAQNAYQKALSIKPKYARAWLNMAIAHSNLQNHDEAARCYLQTLCLNPNATHIWSYLRISLTCSEKWDLLPLAAS
eukprot:CAMPEP_0203675620 /NCGR_PEP_ID=MMETSP0090-20130426/21471_1 /ASSEMBLY_ACC=CAM_ASM_001088 /TAXON_ID=426623 /ORGANISM="Chaetoceros affinis, Strain CCMP159" /LENGTH=602 /DNA_ID=CAMNT_0050541891 /DNA_START=99 /DNA_END=1903 /DNA_ORIENTATION=-